LQAWNPLSRSDRKFQPSKKIGLEQTQRGPNAAVVSCYQMSLLPVMLFAQLRIYIFEKENYKNDTELSRV